MNPTGVRSAALASLICSASYSVMSAMTFLTLSVPRGDQPAAWAAATMTRVTAPGREISDRCPASISVTRACARFDMNSCSAGGITWSAGPISDPDGIVCQAGTPDGSDPALNAIGRWVTASIAAWLAGRPLAKHWAQPGQDRPGPALR